MCPEAEINLVPVERSIPILAYSGPVYSTIHGTAAIDSTFLTTVGGSVRFNPNLYTNGKVCLSVINTWGKNDWTPLQSLSSVILSIQALVFVEYPMKNEPSWYNHSNETDLNKFNQTIIINYVK